MDYMTTGMEKSEIHESKQLNDVSITDVSITEETVMDADVIRVSLLNREDIPVVEQIERENYSLPWSARAFLDALERDYYLFLKAEERGVLAGYCGCMRSFEVAEITNVTVRRDFRRRGIAKRLLTELMDQASALGAERFTLEVRRSNAPAIALYHNLGFRDEGVRRDYYESPREDALILWTPGEFF